MTMTVHEHLKRIGACAEARGWAAQYQTAPQVWDACEHVAWLAWWDVRVHGRAGIARLVALIEEPCCAANPDPRVRAAFRVAANPASTSNELQAAARAAWAAARAAWAAGAAAAWAAEAAWAAAGAAAAGAAARAAWAAAVTPTFYRSVVRCPWMETD